MTHLLDADATRASRRMYRHAAEIHAEAAIRAQDKGRREQARYLARLSLRCLDEAEYASLDARLRRYVG